MGGVIQVNAGGNTNVLGNYNVQSNTEGNTILINQSQSDPKFKTNLSTIPETVPVSTLTNTGFRLSNSSPTAPYDLGSQSTSINQL